MLCQTYTQKLPDLNRNFVHSILAYFLKWKNVYILTNLKDIVLVSVLKCMFSVSNTICMYLKYY